MSNELIKIAFYENELQASGAGQQALAAPHADVRGAGVGAARGSAMSDPTSPPGHTGRSRPPWLPEGFSFLSGLPGDLARKRTLLVPIQAFVDESGGKGQGPVFVMGGMVGSAEAWASFSTEWSECLGRKPSIPHLSMRMAASRRGMFEGWSHATRDAKLRELVSIMGSYPLTAIYTVIDLDGFAETLAKEARARPFSDPYFFSFHAMILSVCQELLESGVSEKFEIIFDEQKVHGAKAKSWYPLLRYAADAEDQAILPTDILFRSDTHTMPLQGADMLSWLFRRSWSGQRTGLEWIAEELQKTIPMSAHSQIFTRERMKHQVALSYTEEYVTKVNAIKKLMGL